MSLQINSKEKVINNQDCIKKDQLLQQRNVNQTGLAKSNQNRGKIQEKQQQIDSYMKNMRSIKTVEMFFNKKYFGNKNQSKSANRQKFIKNPKFNEAKADLLFKLKIGNLNHKLKEIQTIFKTEKKANKSKKTLIKPQFTVLQLYLTKRDILKENNEHLDDIRKLYNQQKRIKDNSKGKQKQKRTQKIAYQEPDKQLARQVNRNQADQQNCQQNALIQQHPPYLQKQKDKKLNDKPKVQQSKPQFLENRLNTQKIKDDDYFETKFQQKILKINYNKEPKLSIKSLLDRTSRRKDTCNTNQLISKQLNQIQNVAQMSIQNYQMKEKINRALDHHYAQSQTDFKSVIRSPAHSPVDFSSLVSFKTQNKSINWILNQCDTVRKQFNIRKSKSMKLTNKNK